METPSEAVLSPRIKECIADAAREQGIVGDVKLEVKLGSSDGENFLGVVYSVTASGRSSDGRHCDAHFFLKTTHPDATARGHLQSADVFAKEIKFYRRILPAFRELQRRRCRNGTDDLLAFAPKCFAAESDGYGGDFILMEDLKASGFIMGDRTKGMNREEVFLAVKAMGQLHAFSYAMNELEPETFTELSEGLKHVFFVPEKRELYRETIQKAGDKALEVVRARSPASAEYLEPWISEGFVDGITEVCEMKEPLSVINHGDIWMNNVLFRESPVKEIVLLDYQMIQAHSPAIDLLYTLYTSLKKTLRDEIYENLLAEYHGALTSTLRLLRVRDDILTMETLKEHLKKYSMYGLGLSIFLVPAIFGEATEEIVYVADGDATSNMVWNHGVFMRDEDIQVLLTDIVDEFVRRGYFRA